MKALCAQFRRPTGALGWLVGVAMAGKNAARSRWALALLAPQPGEHVLEVGFGSGADIARLVDAVGPEGTVTGVDASDVMLRMATRRNRSAVEAGRARLCRADVPDLPVFARSFDAAYSVNCAQFWPDLDAGFVAIRAVVRSGGRLAVAVQPKHRGASVADSNRWLEDLGAAAQRSGWAVVAQELGAEPVPTAAVLLRTEKGAIHAHHAS